jgi:hypothetical protein
MKLLCLFSCLRAILPHANHFVPQCTFIALLRLRPPYVLLIFGGTWRESWRAELCDLAFHNSAADVLIHFQGLGIASTVKGTEETARISNGLDPR